MKFLPFPSLSSSSPLPGGGSCAAEAAEIDEKEAILRRRGQTHFSFPNYESGKKKTENRLSPSPRTEVDTPASAGALKFRETRVGRSVGGGGGAGGRRRREEKGIESFFLLLPFESVHESMPPPPLSGGVSGPDSVLPPPPPPPPAGGRRREKEGFSYRCTYTTEKQ